MKPIITASVMALVLALPVFSAESASQSVRVRSSSHTSVNESTTSNVQSETREETTTNENGKATTRNFRHVFSCVGQEDEDRTECMEAVEWNDDGNRGSATRRIDSDDDDTAGFSRFASTDAWRNLPAEVRAFIENHLSSRVSRSVLSETDEEDDTDMDMKERSRMRREMRRVSWELCSKSFAFGGKECLRGSVENTD